MAKLISKALTHNRGRCMIWLGDSQGADTTQTPILFFQCDSSSTWLPDYLQFRPGTKIGIMLVDAGTIMRYALRT